MTEERPGPGRSDQLDDTDDDELDTERGVGTEADTTSGGAPEAPDDPNAPDDPDDPEADE
jgi:hypothetical protein